VHITQSRHLTGNFNAHLADCLFLFADEVTWGGDKPGEGALKGLITEKTIQIEPKGINCFSLRNRIKVLIASNSDWVVPVTEDERRFLVLDVSEAKRGNREYFDKLHAAIEGGEAAAMLHELMHLDLTGFSHRDVPHTDGLNHQKVEGLDSVGRWWMSCLEEGRIVGGRVYENSMGDPIGSKHWPGEMNKSRVHDAYIEHCRDHGERHPKDEARFPTAWKRFAPSMQQHKPLGQPRRWQFQGLQHHREEFMRVMNINGWTWRPVNEHGEDIDETVTPFRGKEGSK
jgi:phage/plasmid-associated DNA primase